MVGKLDIFETYRFAGVDRKGQRLGTRLVFNRRIILAQVEQNFHIKEVLLEFAIDGSQKVERKRKLEDQLVDHH